MTSEPDPGSADQNTTDSNASTEMGRRSYDFFKGLKFTLAITGAIVVWGVLWFVAPDPNWMVIVCSVVPIFLPLICLLIWDVLEHFFCKYRRIGGAGVWSDPSTMCLAVVVPAMGAFMVIAAWGVIALSIDFLTGVTQILLLLTMIAANRLVWCEQVSSAALANQPSNMTPSGASIQKHPFINSWKTTGIFGLSGMWSLIQQPFVVLIAIAIFAPLTALMMSVRLNINLQQTRPLIERSKATAGTIAGVVLGLFLILGATLPHTINRRLAYEAIYGIEYSPAGSYTEADTSPKSESVRRKAVQKLRMLAIPQLLLEDCYGPTVEIAELLLALASQNNPPRFVSPQDIRKRSPELCPLFRQVWF